MSLDQPSVEVPVTVKVTHEDLRSLLCSALEGGSNYWYSQLHYELPEGITFDDFRKGGKYHQEDWTWPYLIPFVQGCNLTLVDYEDDAKVHKFGLPEIVKGIRILAEKYPHRFSEVMKENTDADTGDCFLQCVVFGEVIYG